MYFNISYKCVVGEVGSYCQLVVIFFFLVSPYQTRDNVVPQFIFDPPFYKSGSTPGINCVLVMFIHGYIKKGTLCELFCLF